MCDGSEVTVCHQKYLVEQSDVSAGKVCCAGMCGALDRNAGRDMSFRKDI